MYYASGSISANRLFLLSPSAIQNRKGIIQSLSGLQVYTGRLLHYDFAKSTVQKFIPLQIVCGFFLVKLHVFVTSV